MGQTILILLVIVCAAWVVIQVPVLNRKLFPGKHRRIENGIVYRELQLIAESVRIAESSKRIDTIVSRFDLAIEKLILIISHFPHRDDWRRYLESVHQRQDEAIKGYIRRKIETHMEKAELVKTLSAKINNANKAIEFIREMERDGLAAADVVERTTFAVRLFIHSAEYKDLLVKADRFEFKKNYKKALDAYKNALFFLKKDYIPDEEQAEQIGFLNGKIAEMEAHISSS